MAQTGEQRDWIQLISQEESGGPPSDTDDTGRNFTEIGLQEARSDEKLKTYMHACHAMIYAKDDGMLWTDEKKHAAVLMQARFDGKIGFPGGMLDKGPTESVTEALDRELEEEINLDLTKHRFHMEEHLVSHVNHTRKLVTHFFTKEVTYDQLVEIEGRMIQAKEWGVETFGTMRVPLYLFRGTARGFPIFLTNRFCGSCKMQMITALQKRQVVPREHLDKLMEAYINYAHQGNYEALKF